MQTELYHGPGERFKLSAFTQLTASESPMLGLLGKSLISVSRIPFVSVLISLILGIKGHCLNYRRSFPPTFYHRIYFEPLAHTFIKPVAIKGNLPISNFLKKMSNAG